MTSEEDNDDKEVYRTESDYLVKNGIVATWVNPEDGKEYEVGEIIPFKSTTNGTYVMKKWSKYIAKYVVVEFGPIREAGGFLGGHECYHRWEMLLATIASRLSRLTLSQVTYPVERKSVSTLRFAG